MQDVTPSYANILVPTDGSEGALRATAVGAEIASRFDGKLHSLYVIDSRTVMDHADFGVERAETEAESALDEAATRAREFEVPVEKLLRRGVPHEQIVDAVDDHDIDLIVIGAQGRTGLDRFVKLGSTAERVVRYAPVRVLTVPVAVEVTAD